MGNSFQEGERELKASIRKSANVYSPPNFPDIVGKTTIFLGGSIEMGAAENWQEGFIVDFLESFKLVQHSFGVVCSISYHDTSSFCFLNPRRGDWDNSWYQSIENPQFFQQVSWELNYLEKATHKVFYFAADTLSPITLLELGKFHLDPNVYICWHEKYKRAGNLEVFCNRYNLKTYKDLKEITNEIRRRHNDSTGSQSYINYSR